MENIVISDGDYQEMLPFMNGINSTSENNYILKLHTANGLRTGKISEIKRYGAYFTVPIRYFIKRKKYGIIIGWQQFYALIFSFYCSLFHVKKCNPLIALNFTYKDKSGKLGGIYKKFMQKCLNPDYLDCIHLPSGNNADITSREFNFPRERIIVAPFGIVDEYERLHKLPCPDEMKEEQNKYFLSIGRSNRDYDFLIDTWNTQNIEQKLVIISDTYQKTTDNPNIIIKRDVAGDMQFPWITNCKAVIIPLDDPTICSGDTVLLYSMSLKKIPVVTSPSTLAEMYVRNGENGLTIEKDKSAFSALIREIADGNYDHIQEQARKSFLENFSREILAANVSDFLKNLFAKENK